MNQPALRLAFALVVALCPIASLAQSPPLGAVVQTWNYDPVAKVLTLHVLNTSHKDITAYNISLTIKYADGTTAFAESTKDFSPLMATMLEAGSDGYMRAKYGNGTFAAGASRDDTFAGQPKDITDVTAILDVVAYSDSTADVQNERAFNRLVVMRRGRALAAQKVTEVIRQVLNDPKISNPSAAAAAELTRLADVSRTQSQHLEEGQIVADETALRSAAGDLKDVQAPSRVGMTERDYLSKYILDNQNRFAVMSAHASLSKAGGAQ